MCYQNRILQNRAQGKIYSLEYIVVFSFQIYFLQLAKYHVKYKILINVFHDEFRLDVKSFKLNLGLIRSTFGSRILGVIIKEKQLLTAFQSLSNLMIG